MNKHLRIGKIAGIPLLLHWSLLLVVGWLLYTTWQGGFDFNRLKLQWLSIWVFLVFLSIFLHELGHAIMARKIGIQTKQIILYPLGGGAFLEKKPETPNDEIKVAFAGPFANILLAGFAAVLIWVFPGTGRIELLESLLKFSPQQIFGRSEWMDYAIVIFFILNIVLAVFNLLPAFPLDGGRILRAFFQKILPHRQATQIAAGIGLLFAIGFVILAAWMEDWVFGFGAMFIGVFAIAELKQQQQIAKLENLRVGDYYSPEYQSIELSPELSWGDFYSQLQACEFELPIAVLDETQQLYMIVTAISFDESNIPKDQPFRAVLPEADWKGFRENDPLSDVVKFLSSPQYAGFPVLNQEDKIIGILRRDKLEFLLQA